MKLHEKITEKKTEYEKDGYHAKYDEFKKQGHPFWPDIIFEDTIAMVVVLLAIIALTMFQGVPLGAIANPSDTNYIPRPEWYFMFLFQLLRYFPGSLEWVGVAVVPGVIILFLLLLPFLDRHPLRMPVRRPLAMSLAVLATIGVFFLTIKAYETTPPTAGEVEAGIQLSSIQQMGRNIFLGKGCTSCHSLAGTGSGLPLEGTGSRLKTEEIHNYIENPRDINTNASMPSFQKTMTHQEVEAVSKYLSIFK